MTNLNIVDKQTKIPELLITQAHKRSLVFFAGAGVSAASPSKLPGWYGINEKITSALCERIEQYLEKPGYTDELEEAIKSRRNDHNFPPDYQAQILEEVCGGDYFKSLTSLNIDHFNNSHYAIAWMAKKELLKAIVTTNFDSLIEKALDELNVPHRVAFDEKTYAECLESLSNPNPAFYVIKVHGSVQDYKSMIDTLKQRLLGRSNDLNQCMEILLKRHYWLYAGFSAEDLMSDKNYLRILPSANESPGLTYLQWPGPKDSIVPYEPKLSDGAKLIEAKYGDRASMVISEADDFINAVCGSLKLQSAPKVDRSVKSTTESEVIASLKLWANNLHPAAVVTCLAAIAESCGEVRVAFHLLRRFWKDVYSKDRKGIDFDNFRFFHGRLGVGGGNLTLIEGEMTNTAFESLQNLYRVGNSDHRAWAWAGMAHLWAGEVEKTNNFFNQAINSFGKYEEPTLEDIDAWLAISEGYYILLEPQWSIKTYLYVFEAAKKIGDLPRQAKILSFVSLLYADFISGDFISKYKEFEKLAFNQSKRLNDPQVMAFQNLAYGRYYTKKQSSKKAIVSLSEAIKNLDSMGREPWLIFAKIEYAKALADGQKINEVKMILDDINSDIDRYQVLLPWYEEAKGQIYLCNNQYEESQEAFNSAVDYALHMGLNKKATQLKNYLNIK